MSIQVGEVSVRALLHTDLGREGGRVGWDQTPDPHPEVPSPVHQGIKEREMDFQGDDGARAHSTCAN